jgi:hypothetical protein
VLLAEDLLLLVTDDASGRLAVVVDPRPYQMSRRQLRARAAEIAQGNWASEAVRKAIDQALAAVAAASAAATAATSG